MILFDGPALPGKRIALIVLAAGFLAARPICAQIDEPEPAGVEELADAGPVDAESETQEAPEGRTLDYTLMELIQFGGVIGYLIILLSFATVALIIDDALLLRRKVLIPPEEVGELDKGIRDGRYPKLTGDEAPSSFVGKMTMAGVAERDRGYEAVVKAMEDEGDAQVGRLLRRVEHLNIIANVAPMLGLLGTVVGMVKCFNQISVSAGGADPRLLAAGIFQALMTTVMGLTVAIPTLFAFGMFRNRVDALAAEATATAEKLVAPLRQRPSGANQEKRLARA